VACGTGGGAAATESRKRTGIAVLVHMVDCSSGQLDGISPCRVYQLSSAVPGSAVIRDTCEIREIRV
jgi:hypothetical protein